VGVERELTRRQALAGLGGACALFFGAVTVTFDPPRVVSVESEFGTVREQSADVDTTIVVENPNGRAIPGSHAIEYGVTLNGITVADGRKRGVRIGTDRTVVETTARFDNTAIPEWWATHVNSGEESTTRTRSRVDPAGLPFGLSLPAEETDIETDFLGSLGGSEPSTVLLGEREILTVGDQRAEWGEADGDRSPLQFTTQVENVHERPVGIDGTDYEIRMNEVVVGAGETDDPIELAPGESAAFTVEAAIDTPRTQQWWVSHLRNDQTTDLTIAVHAVAVDEGTRKRLPLAILDQQSTFETDMLGSGETAVEPVEGEPTEAFAEPAVQGTTSDWGEVRDDETDIETTVTVRNDNEEGFNDLLSLAVDRETSIAGVTVASGTDRVEGLPQGEGEIGLTSTKPHAVVPEWWATHLRNGERSASRTEVTAEADVTVTTLPLDLDDRENVVGSDLLADLDDDSRQPVTAGSGATLFVVHRTTSEWVDPTPERGPVRVEADIENASPEGLTIREIDVSIDINGVVLADERLPDEYTFDPGERRTVTFRLTLDNSRMEAWWPTHVRNDEVSEVTREVTATVEGDMARERTTLDFLSEVAAIETDLLGE